MRTRTAMTVSGSVASLLLLGGVAYAAVQSVDDRPGPQVVVPNTSDDRQHARHGADDDPATHDVNDDSGSSNSGSGSDDSGSGHGGHGGDD